MNVDSGTNDCLSSGIGMSAVKNASDQDEIKVMVKDTTTPASIDTQSKNDCGATNEPTMSNDSKASFGKTHNEEEYAFRQRSVTADPGSQPIQTGGLRS